MVENVKNLGSRLGVASGLGAGMVVLGFMLAGPASAADAEITGAFTSLEADLKTYITAIVGLVVLSLGAMLGIKYARKAISKA